MTDVGDAHGGDFQIQSYKLKQVCKGWGEWLARGLFGRGFGPLVASEQRCGSGSAIAGFAVIMDGDSRSEAAKAGGATLRIVRDWVLRFNAEGPDGLASRKSSIAPLPRPSWTAPASSRVRLSGKNAFLRSRPLAITFYPYMDMIIEPLMERRSI